jgi:hypothetical protein
MSIIERLTEGMVQRDMKKEGQALLDKWTRTGLLEGLEDSQSQHNMARLLENQAKELLRESSSMAAGDVEGFAAVAFPIVRRVFAGLIANDLVSVQPMSLPSGLIFFLDFKFSPNAGASGSQIDPRFGNAVDKSIYGTNQVGAEVIDGVDLVNATTGEGFGGPGRDGSVGYAYASPSGSNHATTINDGAGSMQVKASFLLNGAVSDANQKLIKYDPDLLALTNSTAVLVVDIEEEELESATAASPDFDNLSAFQIDEAQAITSFAGLATDANQIRRLTQLASASEAATDKKAVRFVLTSNGGSVNTTVDANIAKEKVVVPIKDSTASSATSVGALTTFALPMEGESEIPEIDIKVDSTAITAQTKKLKAKWTPELGQDLNAYHNLDAEVELTSILSEQIALEIDREILADLVNGATAGTYYWSRSPGLFVDRVTGAELGATAAAPDFTGTVSEWYETLIETINDVSAQIHRKTLRGGANFVVCSPEVANILEFTAGFRANVTADADKGEIGAVKVGSLSRKFDVMVDPYFPRNVILVGRRGASFLESGYVYAPYVPLQVTPTIFGVEDFVPRKGVMTRYAKKMVRADMYGLVICRGLLGESGAS